MSLWFSAVMGLIQGLTEFIPVSSSAHLRLAPALFHQPDPGAAFTAVIQFGTLAAVIVYFARDLFVDLPRAMFKEPGSPNGRLPYLLVLATLPIVLGGLLLKHHIEGNFRSLYVVATTMTVVGAILVYVDRRAAASAAQRTIHHLVWSDALLIGLAQTCALVPGVSRSGATICMALMLGMRRSDAARFSFLMSIPAVGGAGILELKEALHGGALGGGALVPILVATGVAAVSGYLTIAWFMRWLSSRELTAFGVYRIVLGALIFALLASHVIAA